MSRGEESQATSPKDEAAGLVSFGATLTGWNDRWSGKTIWMALDEAVRRQPEREAYVFANGRMSLGELQRRADAAARGFLALGVGRGDRVAIWMAGYAEWAYVYFALARIGAVMVPLNTRYRPSEMEYVLKKSHVQMLVFKTEEDKDYAATLLDLCPELRRDLPGQLQAKAVPTLKSVVAVGESRVPGSLTLDELFAAGRSVSDERVAEAERQVVPDDVALIQFTSGTTAFPKGAQLFQAGMLRGGQANADAFRLSSTDCFFSPQPFYHCGGSILVMLSPIVSGCRTVVQPYFDAGQALRLMEEEQCNCTMGHQPHWIEYLNHPDRQWRNVKLDKALIFATPEVNRLVHDTMHIEGLASPYGMTETHLAGTFCSLDDPLEVRLSTVGRSCPGMQMEIRDPSTGQVTQAGQSGEICFRGWGLMKGYYDDPERTAEAFTPDGWFRTGDLGVLDQAGDLRIIGRLKEMIRVGGENVAAAEVEGFLLRHPSVKQAVVVGKPDARLVEVCLAYVQLKSGATANEEELRSFCRSGLASFKVPRHIRFVTEWPMSGTGKIQRFLLKEAAAKG